MMTVRSGAALRRHFDSHGQHTGIVTALLGDRLTAYAILTRRDISEMGLTRLRAVDSQAV